MARIIDPMNIPHPDFVLGQVIEPEEFDANNKVIQDKTNEVISQINNNSTTIENIDLKVNDAVIGSGEAIAYALGALNTANGAVTIANSATVTAGQAVDSANIANDIANGAVVIATTADNVADNAVEIANTAKADVANMQPILTQAVSDVNNAVASVANKVDKSYVDQVASNFVLGTLSDGSVVEQKLHPDVREKLNSASQVVQYTGRLEYTGVGDMPVPIPSYNPTTDTVYVYNGGIFQTLDVEYSLNTSLKTISDLTGSWKEGMVFDFVLFKNIGSVPNVTFDGSLLDDGSVGANKLHPRFMDELGDEFKHFDQVTTNTLRNLDYPDAEILGRVISLRNFTQGKMIRFKLNEPIGNGDGIGITLEGEGAVEPLRTTLDEAVTSLEKGFYEVIADAGFFTLRPSGGKKLTGDNVAVATSVSGTTLKLTPPKGCFDGVAGNNVTITDADFVAGNIKNGVNLFGKAGTLVDGIPFTPEKTDMTYPSMQQASIAYGATGDVTATILETTTETRIIHYYCTARTNDMYGIILNATGTSADNTYNSWANLELHDKLGNSIILVSSYQSGIQSKQPINAVEIKDFTIIVNDRKVLFNWYDYDNQGIVTGSEKSKVINLPAGFVLTNGVKLVLRAQIMKAHASFHANAQVSGTAGSHKFKIFNK